jgi:hypothetical protein
LKCRFLIEKKLKILKREKLLISFATEKEMNYLLGLKMLKIVKSFTFAFNISEIVETKATMQHNLIL